jgi:hypothetical protein
MTRIRTGNARRRARARRALGRDVLQAWECYVDDFDARKVYLMMADLTVDRGGEREYGSFPRRLFNHIDVRRGLLVTVECLRCRKIEIRPIPPRPRDPEAARKLSEMLDMLRQLRDEHDERTSDGSAGREDGMKATECGMCGRRLDVAADPLSRDCGGDCWGCIGEIEAESGYAPSAEKVEAERNQGLRTA